MKHFSPAKVSARVSVVVAGLVLAAAATLAGGCSGSTSRKAADTDTNPQRSTGDHESRDSKESVVLPVSATAPGVREAPESILAQVRAFQSAEMPPASFEPGHAESLEESELELKSTDYGYVVQFPSDSPIPPPTVLGDRVFISGGFNSESYHCLNADTGKSIWDIELDDDGPTSGVPHDDLILLGTESCTVFGIEMASGKLRWSAYLGDPLLSTPSIADGRMVTVYPAASSFPEALEQLRAPAKPAEPTDASNIDPEGTDPSEDMAPLEERTATEGVETRPAEKAKRLVDLVEPTHIAICMDGATGKVIWRTWIDSDCLTAPVIDGDDVYIMSLSGNLYQLSLTNGVILSALRLGATSAPVVGADSIFFTRRLQEEQQSKEYVARLDRETFKPRMLASAHDAPYLDAKIQMQSGYASEAVDHGTMNGFGGGGFGGGFAVPDEPTNPKVNQDAPVPDDSPIHPLPQQEEKNDHVAPVAADDIDYNRVQDLLGYTELQAAENIGMGNASTIQGFMGSLSLLHEDRVFNAMGNQLVATSTESGKSLWSMPLTGDHQKIGGHLCSAPVLAGKMLVVATYNGDVLRVNPKTGESKTIQHLDAHFRLPPVIASGKIFVTSQDGRLFCIKTDDPSLGDWTQLLGAPHHNQSR